MTTTRAEQRTVPQTEREQQTLRDLLPLYAVILHNDDVNPMDFVIQAVLKSVPSLSIEEASRIMMEAHNEGRAVVIVCPLEPAELYRDRILSFGLGCTLEKA